MPHDIYDSYPRHMLKYLRNYGWHFNKALCEWAVSKMKRDKKRIEPITREKVDALLAENKVVLANNKGYDYVFVANMGKADYLGSSIPDVQHLALYIKDTIDDEDAGEGTTMRRWFATMVANGEVVDWEDFV